MKKKSWSKITGRTFLSCCLSFFFLNNFAKAEELNRSDFLETRAFLTVGSVISDSPNSFSNGITNANSTLYDSKLGLNLSRKINSEWRVAVQFLALLRPSQNDFNVDWAFATYHPFESLSLNFGKHRLPLWLTSDYVNVGKLYPWVRPPVEVYEINPIKDFIGLSADYDIQFGWMDASLTAFIGNISDKTVKGGLINPNSARTNYVTMQGVRGVKVHLTNDYITLRGGYTGGTADIVLDELEIHKIPISFYTVGLKIDWHGAVLLAEHVWSKAKISDEDKELGNQDFINSLKTGNQDIINASILRNLILNSNVLGNKAYYVTLGYFLNKDFLAHASYAQIKSPSNNLNLGSQHSYTIGTKYDVNLRTDFKLEYQRVFLDNNSTGLYTVDKMGLKGKELQKNINIYSIALDFIF